MFGRVFHESRSTEFGRWTNERGRMGSREILWLGSLAAAARLWWPRQTAGLGWIHGWFEMGEVFLACVAISMLALRGDRRHTVFEKLK